MVNVLLLISAIGDLELLSFKMDGQFGGGGDLTTAPPTNQVSNFENTLLIGDVAREEIWVAIWAMVGDEAPDLDGFSSFYFGWYWAIIYGKVMEVIQ